MISMNDSLETVFEEYQTRLIFLFLFIEGSTWRCVDKAFSFCRYSEYWNLLTLISFSGTDFVQSIWRFQLGSEHEECSIFLLFRSFSRNTTQINIPAHPVVPAVQTRETFSASALEIDFSLNITTLDFLVDPDALLCSTL